MGVKQECSPMVESAPQCPASRGLRKGRAVLARICASNLEIFCRVQYPGTQLADSRQCPGTTFRSGTASFPNKLGAPAERAPGSVRVRLSYGSGICPTNAAHV